MDSTRRNNQCDIRIDAELACLKFIVLRPCKPQKQAKLEECRRFQVEVKRRRIFVWRIRREWLGAFRISYRMGRWYWCSIAAGGDRFVTASWRIIATVTLRFVQQAQA